jgi:glycosyltransferase involved in cell wall biosynthesis
MSGDTIHHFGPDPTEVGGMGSVIRVLTEHRVGADSVQIHPTWRRSSRSATICLTTAAALTIARMRRGEVVHVHLSEKGSFLREGALLMLARRRRLTTVATIHGADFLSFARRRPQLVSSVLRQASLVTCLDRDVLANVRRLAPRVKAEVLPNPVPMDASALSADKTSELVLFAGEIGRRKGADVLLEAWRLVAARRPAAQCLMVGPVNDFVVPQTERLTVRSPVDASEMVDLLRAARVVALPSRAEGLPMILAEAMAGGRPFVSTPVGGIPDLGREGGMLVAVGDDVSLARCLTELLADPELARQMGERARRFCEETRSVQAVDARLRELYLAASQA